MAHYQSSKGNLTIVGVVQHQNYFSVPTGMMSNEDHEEGNLYVNCLIKSPAPTLTCT